LSLFELPELPDLSRPIARGASRCHVLALYEGEEAVQKGTMAALCGIACGGFCGEAGFEEGMTHCPEHREPLCPECLEIVEDPLWQAGFRELDDG
jgi:hypothetical protein